MIGNYSGITRADLFDQHDFFMERCKAATTKKERIEALKKAATTRRMIAGDPSLRHWVIRRVEAA